MNSNYNWIQRINNNNQGNHNYHELPQIALLKENKGTTIYPKQNEELQLLNHINRKRGMRRLRIGKWKMNQSMN